MKILLTIAITIMVANIAWAQNSQGLNSKFVKDTRPKVKSADTVYVCMKSTAANRYVQNGICHINTSCKEMAKCTGEIESTTYSKAKYLYKARKCQVCCKPTN